MTMEVGITSSLGTGTGGKRGFCPGSPAPLVPVAQPGQRNRD